MIKLLVRSTSILVILLQWQIANASTVNESYDKFSKQCDGDQKQFYGMLQEVDHAITDYSKNKDKKELFKKAEDPSIEGQIFLFLGSYVLGTIDKGDLKPQRTCWLYYNNFLVLGSQNSPKAQSELSNWETCLYGIYPDGLPEVPEKVISCYRKVNRMPDSVKKKKTSPRSHETRALDPELGPSE